MKTALPFAIFLLLSSLLFNQSAQASHVAGADITWTCLGNNQFEILLSVYTDCDGISPSTGTEGVTIENNCGLPVQNINLNYILPTGPTTPDGGVDIAQLCSQDSLNSTCFGGTDPGMQMTQYSAIVTLPTACNFYTIGWDICCRNNAVVNLQNPGAAGTYVEANIYTANDPCDNSPIFTAQPIPYVCVNQPVFYNFGAVDPDGDSLVYSLIPAREMSLGAPILLPYSAGYTSPQPVPGITLNPNTGEISFTPTVTGNFVVVILIQSFDPATGLLVGEVMRDIQFTVIPCSNVNPNLPTAGVTNVGGTGSLTGPFSFDMCVGTNITFDITFTDPDPSDTLTVTSNIATLLPGATISQSGINPLTVSVAWSAVGNTASTLPLTLNVEDNSCPIAGFATQTIVINITPSASTGPDINLCEPDTVSLNVNGGTSFVWQVLSGPPMVLGQNFSCDTCASPWAFPSATTTYTVSSNLNSLCNNTDTIVVNITPPFDFSTIGTTDVTCNGSADGEIILGAPLGNAPSPYTWDLFDAAMTLVGSNTGPAGHTFTGLQPGTYSVTLSEAGGCTKDTANLVIGEPAAMTITTGDTLICQTSVATIAATASGGNGSYTYSWTGFTGSGPHQVSPIDSTYYTVFATDQLGCTSPLDSFLVGLHPLLTVVPSWTDSVCIGDPASFSLAVSGGNGGPYAASWEEIGGGSMGTGLTNSITPTEQFTQFEYTVSDNCGTPIVVDTLPVHWYAPPQPVITPSVPEDCFPASIDFSILTPPNQVGNTCVWDFGDGTSVTGPCGTTNHVFQTVGCYDVDLTIYSPQGCPGDSSFSQIVCARPHPQADYTFGPQPTNIFDPVINFTNASVDGISYFWEFGDSPLLGTSSDVNPTFTFPDTDQGTYPVWLYTTNIFGCVDSALYTVEIDGVFSFFVPNAFTPDGDGVNNEFAVVGQGISSEFFELQIFDRWGQVIWETNDPRQGWDGGTAKTGVYAYRVWVQNRYTRINKEYIGHVTLLR